MGLTFGTDLSGKVAVVTGAGGVLCGMFARTLSEAGAAVALLDINEEAAAKAADEITRLGGRAVAYRADVMDKEELESVHARVLAQLGPCDILVNGAGGNQACANTAKDYFEMGDIEADVVTFFDLKCEGIERVLNLNFMGPLLTSQVFAKDMVGREGCNILNISSASARTGLTRIPIYSGAEAALSNFTQWLSVHFAKAGIRVNAIAPGFFVTKQNERLLYDEDGAPTERTAKVWQPRPWSGSGGPKNSTARCCFF